MYKQTLTFILIIIKKNHYRLYIHVYFCGAKYFMYFLKNIYKVDMIIK